VRVLVVDTDYPQFLSWLYRSNRGLRHASYETQRAVRTDSLFGTAAAYAAAFSALGHEAAEIYADNLPLQRAWAREHGIDVGRTRRPAGIKPRALARRALRGTRSVPSYLVPSPHEDELLRSILLEQVSAFRPELVLNQSIHALDPSLVRAIGRDAVVVGQHAATPLPDDDMLRSYDLLVSSFQPTVDELGRRGFGARLNRLGFDPGVLSALGEPRGPSWGLTFVGSLAPVHSSRRAFLEELAALVPELRIWSHDPIPRSSPLYERNGGPAWGRRMYEILRGSRATVNHHGDIPPYANNLRLYEATGVGTVLLTDAKPNLAELFTPGTEVLTFDSARECADRYLALSDDDRDAVAAAGQRRTLAEHSYTQRVEELLQMVRELR